MTHAYAQDIAKAPLSVRRPPLPRRRRHLPLFAALALGLCACAGVKDGAPPDAGDLAQLFVTLAAGREFGSGIGMARWQGGVDYAVIGSPERRQLAEAEALLQGIAMVTGLAIAPRPAVLIGVQAGQGEPGPVVPPTPALDAITYTLLPAGRRSGAYLAWSEGGSEFAAEADLFLWFLDASQYRRMAGRTVVAPSGLARSVAEGRSWCSGALQVERGSGRILAAHVFLQAGLDPARSRRCVQEEVAQAFGLVNDEPQSALTLFNDVPPEAGGGEALTAIDWLLLEVLYDRRLTSGLAGDPLAAAVRPLIEERMGRLAR